MKGFFKAHKNEENERGSKEYKFGGWKADGPVVLTWQTQETESPTGSWERLNPSYTGVSSKVSESGSAGYLRKQGRAQVKKVG